jgi:hypothetical protein
MWDEMKFFFPVKTKRNTTTPTQGLAFQMMTESFGLFFWSRPLLITYLNSAADFWVQVARIKKKKKKVDFTSSPFSSTPKKDVEFFSNSYLGKSFLQNRDTVCVHFFTNAPLFGIDK